MHINGGIRSALIMILIATVLAFYPCFPTHASGNPAEVKKQFQEVASHLDTGGELFIVANMDGVLEEFIDYIIQFASLAPADDSKAQSFKSTMEKLSSFLRESGFYAVRGLGMSAVPRADGLNDIKYFVSRDSSAAQLPLWRGLAGFKQKKMTGLDFLPVDAVLARATTAELSQLWKLVRPGIMKVGTPEILASFDETVAEISAALGVEVNKLIDSIGDESFISLQFSRKNTINIASPDKPWLIPQPSILLGVAVKDNTLLDVIKNQLTNAAMPMVEAKVGDTVLRSINVPMPLPFPVQPTFATHSGIFLFGSDPAVVTEAINAFQKKNGLVTSLEFKKAFTGLPMVNNGIVYMSPRFMEVVVDIQTKALSQAPGGPSEKAAVSEFFRNIMGGQGYQSCAFVTLNWKSGIATKGVSSSGGKEVIASLAVAPLGLMAAIGVPSFVKARTTSRKNACINNLRMIDGAKEQWAMEHNKNDRDEVDIAGISEYIKGNRLPKCPQGGRYTVNPIGVSPQCSNQQHRLR